MILNRTHRTTTISASRVRILILSLLGASLVLVAICPISSFACDVYDVDMWLGPDTASAQAHMTLDFDACVVSISGWHVHFDAYGPDNSGFYFKVEDLTSPQTMEISGNSAGPDDRSASGTTWWSPSVAGENKTIRVDVRRSGRSWYTGGNTRTITVVRVLDVTVSPSEECVDNDVTFTVVTSPSGHASLIDWSGSGGTPATGSGTQTFDIQWDTYGHKYVRAKCDGHICSFCDGSKTVTIKGMAAVSADKLTPCEGENVIFTAYTSPSGNEGSVTWSGGGTPATGTGETFTTKWTTGSTGDRTVTATYCGHSKQRTVNVRMDCDCTKKGEPNQVPPLPFGCPSGCDSNSQPVFIDDNCGNEIQVECKSPGCYLRWFYEDSSNKHYIGHCPYYGGQNTVVYWLTLNGDRYHSIKYRSLNPYKDGTPNDQGTKDVYDWVVWCTDDCIEEPAWPDEYCRESITLPDVNDYEYWETTGDGSDCEDRE